VREYRLPEERPKAFSRTSWDDDLDELLDKLRDNKDFDLACVVLTPSRIPEACRNLGEAGRHCFVDEPLPLSAGDLVPASWSGCRGR